jgi:membrane AbrB-like protein
VLKPPLSQTAFRVAATFAVSAAGGLVATLLGLPAGWLSGGLLAVVAATLAGLHTEVPPLITTSAFFVLGLYAGSGVSHETLHQMQTWPASFVVLGIALVVLIGSSFQLLNRRYGWDRSAALLAALPGALSFVMAAAEDLKTDMKKVVVAQSVRLIMLVELVPLAALFVGDRASSMSAGNQLPLAGTRDLALLIGCGLAAALLLRLLKLPGYWMLGGLVGSAALLLGGVVEAQLPPFLIVPCTIALAAIAGSRFRPGDLAVLPRLLLPSVVAFSSAATVSVVSAGLVSFLLGIDFIQALLAFSPGAQEAVVILAFAMGFDPAYVAAHQVVRFLLLVALVPLMIRWLRSHP